MTTYLGKSCSFGLPRVPFVNCRQFMYLVISLLVLRAGCGLIVSVPDHCLSFYFSVRVCSSFWLQLLVFKHLLLWARKMEACCLPRLPIKPFVSKLLGLSHTEEVKYRKAPLWDYIWYSYAYIRNIYVMVDDSSVQEDIICSVSMPHYWGWHCRVEHSTKVLI